MNSTQSQGLCFNVQQLQNIWTRIVHAGSFSLFGRSYYEAMAKYKGILESHQEYLNKKKAELVTAKASYSQSLQNLERISEDIHNKRQKRAAQSASRFPAAAAQQLIECLL